MCPVFRRNEAANTLGGGGSLKGKTLFIAGGSRGIGFCIAKTAAKDGANIVIGGKELKWGLDSFWSAKPGDSLYVASSGLAVERYVDVEQGEDPTPPAFNKRRSKSKFDESHVEYGSRDGNKGDVAVFFGGDAVYDRHSTDCIAASPVRIC